MKLIHKKTGIDIFKCNDIDLLRDIIIDEMLNTQKLMEQYYFYLKKLQKEKKSIISANEYLKLKL